MENGMIALISAAVGALAGVVGTLLGAIVNHRFQERRERARWEREDTRATAQAAAQDRHRWDEKRLRSYLRMHRLATACINASGDDRASSLDAALAHAIEVQLVARNDAVQNSLEALIDALNELNRGIMHFDVLGETLGTFMRDAKEELGISR